MKKTTIYLEPEVDSALQRLARRRGVTKAEVIRRALAREATFEPSPRFDAIGVASGPGDVSSDVDRHLRETGFGHS